MAKPKLGTRVFTVTNDETGNSKKFRANEENYAEKRAEALADLNNEHRPKNTEKYRRPDYQDNRPKPTFPAEPAEL